MANFDIFISHSSTDVESANELVLELEKRGLSCWIAPRNIPAGSDYPTEILKAVHQCKALIVLVSESSIESKHVQSEVSRASSEKNPIYPVRLLDIQIAGGLQFFLELSQWIDFFPSPTVESYDKLVAAIKSGKNHKRKFIQYGTNTKLWAIGTIAAVVSVLVITLLSIYGYLGYKEKKEQELQEQYIKESSIRTAKILKDSNIQLSKMNDEHNKKISKQRINSLKVKTYFMSNDSGFFLKKVKLSSYIINKSQYMIEFSENDGGFRKAPLDSKDKYLINLSKTKKITFRIVDKQGKTIKEFDKTSELLKEVERIKSTFMGKTQLMEENERNNFYDSFCNIKGCNFIGGNYNRGSHFCDPFVEKVKLVQGSKSYEVDLGFCKRVELMGNTCVDAQDIPFPLIPNETYSIQYDLIDGTKKSILQNIGVNAYSGQSYGDENFKRLWSLLPAINVDNNSEKKPPILLSTYDKRYGFSFSLGYNNCDGNGWFSNETSQLNVDVDGKGFISVGAGTGFSASYLQNNNVNARPTQYGKLRVSTETKTIKVAFGDAYGIKLGPWEYGFNPSEVVSNIIVGEKIPRIHCPKDMGNIKNDLKYILRKKEFCRPYDRSAFFNVEAVEFGELFNKYTKRINVNFNSAMYLENSCDIRTFMRKMPGKEGKNLIAPPFMTGSERIDEKELNNLCPPFIFIIPDNWKSVYSKIIMKDGSIVSKKRHAFER